jgi:exonuclease III
LSAGLQDRGYKNLTALALPAGQRGVVIASTFPFVQRKATEAELLTEHRWVEVQFPKARLTVAGVYFPDRGPGVAAYWPKVHQACLRLKDQAALIVGDFNSGQTAFDSQGSRLTGDPWFTAMPLHGFTDLWRHRNGAALEYTWYSGGEKNLRGFRIDHAFGSASLRRRIRECAYCHSDRRKGLSDHSSVVVEIR